MRKNIKVTILFLFILLCVFSFSPKTIRAELKNEDVTVDLNPEYPKANENVNASLSSFATDLNKARISWTVNGQLVTMGVGTKDFSFMTGATGTSTTLEVKIETSTGSVLNEKVVITPADIDMLWEAVDSYVPPFYRGKALMSPEGKAKVVAIPNSSLGGGYGYAWKQDGHPMPDSSGYGKNSYTYLNSFLDTKNTVEVSVSNLSGSDVGLGNITINPSNPKILFYKKDPELGIRWEQALPDGFTISSNGETIVAEPYFFLPKDLSSGDLKFTWTLGGSQIDTPNRKNELSVKPNKGQSGSSKIGLSVENIKRLFLSMQKEINVDF